MSFFSYSSISFFLPSSSSICFYMLAFSFSKLAARLVIAYLSFLFYCFNSSEDREFKRSSESIFAC